MSKADKILSTVLTVLCLCTFILSVRYIHQQNKWSPIDEYAHLDYVEKLLTGHVPRLSDPIAEEIYQDIKNNPARAVSGISQTREELGLGNFSYQARHPPLYFMLLSVPEFILQKMNTDVFQRLKFLRMFSYFIFVAGMLMCIPVFRALKKTGFEIPLCYSLGCVFFGLLIFPHERYGLGNNSMSPLLINTAVLFLINYLLKPTNRSLYLFVLFCCLSLLTAFTNIFIVPFLFLFILKKYVTNFTWRNFTIALSLIFVAVLFVLVWQKYSVPDPGFEQFLKAVLTMTLPAGVLEYGPFLNLLAKDTFTLTLFSDSFTITKTIVYLMALNAVLCLCYWKAALKKQTWILYMGILFAAFLLITFLMNKYVGTVIWVGFRHYLGFIPVIYSACTGFILVLYSAYFKAGEEEQEQLL